MKSKSTTSIQRRGKTVFWFSVTLVLAVIASGLFVTLMVRRRVVESYAEANSRSDIGSHLKVGAAWVLTNCVTANATATAGRLAYYSPEGTQPVTRTDENGRLTEIVSAGGFRVVYGPPVLLFGGEERPGEPSPLYERKPWLFGGAFWRWWRSVGGQYDVYSFLQSYCGNATFRQGFSSVVKERVRQDALRRVIGHGRYRPVGIREFGNENGVTGLVHHTSYGLTIAHLATGEGVYDIVFSGDSTTGDVARVISSLSWR